MQSCISTNTYRPLVFLVLCHLIIIAASNYLVQFSFTIYGVLTTWGTFTFPFIFLATDLTVRIFGASTARKIVFLTMFPALIISYLISVLFFEGYFQGFDKLSTFNLFVARIAIASFCAYLIGQVLDIYIFNHLRKNKRWWLAPSTSSIFGNALDTFVFFFIAFYQSPDAFMASNWFNIGLVDFLFKVVVSLILFLPIYGIIINILAKRLIK